MNINMKMKIIERKPRSIINLTPNWFMLVGKIIWILCQIISRYSIPRLFNMKVTSNYIILNTISSKLKLQLLMIILNKRENNLLIILGIILINNIFIKFHKSYLMNWN
jgi:hypothetical protein